MFFIDKDIFASRLNDKAERKILAHGEELMCCHLYFKQGAIGEEHSHENTQIAYVIKGKFEFDLDGNEQVLKTGDSVFVPSGVKHSLICLEDGELLDIFTPPRKDFL